MRIVINTPSGHIGRSLAHRLLDAGAPVTVLSRRPEKIPELIARGARVIEGAIDDERSLAAALDGADRLFWLSPPAFRPDAGAWLTGVALAAAAAARRAGVRRIVVQSSMGAHTGPGTGPVGSLLAIEDAFRAVAPDVIALRAGFFMENLLHDTATLASDGVIFSPHPTDKPLALVATADIAARAAAYLLDSGWSGHRNVGVHGPVDLSYRAVAQVLSGVLERPIRHVQTTLEEARARMVAGGMPSFVADSYRELFASVHDGRLDPAEPRSHETTTGTTLAEFARAVLVPAVRAAQGTVAPANAGLIANANAIMTAWEQGDTEGYRRRCAPGVQMTIPSYQLDLTGFDAIWNVRTAMKPLSDGPLHLHTLASHAVEGKTVIAVAHVIDRQTGQFTQHSTVRFVFDATERLTHYYQDLVWARS